MSEFDVVSVFYLLCCHLSEVLETLLARINNILFLFFSSLFLTQTTKQTIFDYFLCENKTCFSIKCNLYFSVFASVIFSIEN